jgi:hypothetical protein
VYGRRWFMLGMFRAVVDRVKTLLVLKAVEELDVEAAADAAGRQVGPLDVAQGYDRDGKSDVAVVLRSRSGSSSPSATGIRSTRT